MHPSSVNNMRLVRERYLDYLANVPNSRILDVGGIYDAPHKTYLRVFEDLPNMTWSVTDIVAHDTCTKVMPGPYTLPWDNNEFDLVVSGQMLEHCRNPFRSVTEMKRVLKPGGMIVIIAPSAGPRHDKVDCWRFMHDAFASIAQEVGLDTVADWVDDQAPDERSRKWADHVFVGRKPIRS